MIHYKAPDNNPIPDHMMKVFIAGGISNCPDWQTTFIKRFMNIRCAMINPRRDEYGMRDPDMASQQIEWEFKRIEESDIMVFWFPKETLCPITLYELGRASRSGKKIFVGCHPEYARKFDVIKQMELVVLTNLSHRKIVVRESMDELQDDMIEFFKKIDVQRVDERYDYYNTIILSNKE